MGGLTDNANLLAAANQLIKAVNDLADKVGSGSGIESITDAITAQSTMLEMRSVAETEAQNTNFSGLISAVENVNLTVNTGALVSAIQSCCANTNNNLQLMIAAIKAIRLVTVGGGGGGGYSNGGPYIDPPAIIPGDPGMPPIGAVVNTEKCQAANYVFWSIISTLQSLSSLQDLNFALIGAIGGEGLIAELLIVSGIISVSTAGASLIVSVLAGLILVAMNWKILASLEYLANSFEADKEDIVCHLYNAADANEARSYLYSVLNAKVDEVIALPIIVEILSGVTLPVLKYALASIVEQLACNYLVNILFEPDAEVLATEIPDAIDCGALTDGTYYYPGSFYHFTNEANFTSGPNTLSTFSDSGAVAVYNPERGNGLPDEVGAEFDFKSGNYTTYLYMADMGGGLTGPGTLTVSVRVYVPNIGFFRNPQIWTSADGLTWIRAGGGGISWDMNTQQGDWVWSVPVGAHSGYMPLRYVALRFEPPWGYGAPGYPHGFIDTFRVEGADSGGCGQ